MQSETGIIKEFMSEAEAKKAGFDLMLTKEQHSLLEPMNRKERRAWAKKNKTKKQLH